MSSGGAKYEPLAAQAGAADASLSVNQTGGKHHKHKHSHHSHKHSKALVDAAAKKVSEEAARHSYSALAYWIMLLQGFGLLLSWNVLLNAIGFFQDEYPDNKNGISFYLTAAYTYPQVPLLLLMVKYGGRFSFNVRILSCLVIQAVCMAGLPLLASTSVWTTLSIVFVIGVTTAILQSSLFGLASMFPAVYAQGLMSGQGVAGILASVAEIIVKASIPANNGDDNDGQKTAAIIYFVFSASTLAACIGSYIVLMRMPFTQFHLNKANGATSGVSKAARAAARTLGVEVSTPRLNAIPPSAAAALVPPTSLEITAAAGDKAQQSSLSSSSVPLLDEENGEEEGAQEEEDADNNEPALSTWGVMQKIAVLATSVFLVFFVTFLVFPSVAPFGIDFKGSGLGKLSLSSDWWATILLLVFNVCDTCGRILPAFVALLKGKGLLLATVLRSGLIIILVGCARSWSSGFNDLTALLIFILFSFTNGYFASLAMMNGPQQVRSKDRQQAGFMMSLFLQLGILAGSQASFGLKPPQTG